MGKELPVIGWRERDELVSDVRDFNSEDDGGCY